MHIRVLGPMEVLDGTEWRSIGAAKWRALLAVLVITPDRVVSVARIAAELWGDAPPATVANQIHGYVGRLRRLLRDGEGESLVRQSPGYRLRIGPQDTDLGRFAALAEQGRSALRVGRRDEAATMLGDAQDLWRGAAFQDVPPTPLVEAETLRLVELRAVVREDLAQIWLLRDDPARAVAELAELIAEEPLRERARELQMLALYRQGRQAEALGVYVEVRTRLADELGVDPGPGLQNLYQQILRADPALARATREKPEKSDQEPVGPALPLRQLPPDVPDFAGRSGQVEAVTELLRGRVESGPPPMAVVVGAPGVGKSMLAVHAAHAVSAEFPDGQLYLDLGGMSAAPRSPTEVLAEALQALGVTGPSVPGEVHERVSLYRSLLARRRMLLVFDDAAHAAQVRPLLPSTGSCAVVVTTRRQVTDLAGARHIELDVLDPLAAAQLFASIVGADRVAAEPEQAEAILRFCGHLPLAIRIAGGRLASRPAWPLRVLRDRLEDESRRLGELRVGDLEVRASFDLSLLSLPSAVIEGFALLGLLGAQSLPGWVLGPLLDRDDADDVLDVLVDANLIRLTGSDALGQPRYRIHDLLRAYGVEAAASFPVGRRRAAVTRLLAAWLQLVEHAAGELPPSLFRPPRGTSSRQALPPGTARRLVARPKAWFDAERVTLLGAVTLAVDWGLAEPAWELAANLVSYYDLARTHEDWQHSHELALRAVREAGNRRGEAVLLNGLAQLWIYHDRLDEAGANLTRSRQLYRGAGDERGEALAIAGLAAIERVLGNHERAADHLRRALALATAAGERHLEAHLHNGVAAIHLAQGHIAEARSAFEQALHLSRELGDVHREAVVLREMSQLHQQEGRTERAVEYLSRAKEIFEGLHDERCVAYTLMTMGRVHAERHERTETASTLERAAGLFALDGDRINEATCWQLLGELDDDPVRLTRALRLWRLFGAQDRVTEIEARLRHLEGVPSTGCLRV
jgi:DNA-binding SARP family transcriptional activator